MISSGSRARNAASRCCATAACTADDHEMWRRASARRARIAGSAWRSAVPGGSKIWESASWTTLPSVYGIACSSGETLLHPAGRRSGLDPEEVLRAVDQPRRERRLRIEHGDAGVIEAIGQRGAAAVVLDDRRAHQAVGHHDERAG